MTKINMNLNNTKETEIRRNVRWILDFTGFQYIVSRFYCFRLLCQFLLYFFVFTITYQNKETIELSIGLSFLTFFSFVKNKRKTITATIFYYIFFYNWFVSYMAFFSFLLLIYGIIHDTRFLLKEDAKEIASLFATIIISFSLIYLSANQLKIESKATSFLSNSICHFFYCKKDKYIEIYAGKIMHRSRFFVVDPLFATSIKTPIEECVFQKDSNSTVMVAFYPCD